jgi:SHS2 domain-containing protein
MAPYVYLEHTADTGIVATGETLQELFRAAAEGLASILYDPEGIPETESSRIEATADDVESLLVEWLSEVNFHFEVDRIAYRRFDVTEATETHVRGMGHGAPVDPKRHRLGEQVKAVTYHGLKVERTDGQWSAQVIFDV